MQKPDPAKTVYCGASLPDDGSILNRQWINDIMIIVYPLVIFSSS